MSFLSHRCSQGVQWVYLHPTGRKKNFRRNLEEKFVSAPQHTKCTPAVTRSASQVEQESIFEDIFAVRGRFGGESGHLVVLDRLLKATTNKGRQFF